MSERRGQREYREQREVRLPAALRKKLEQYALVKELMTQPDADHHHKPKVDALPELPHAEELLNHLEQAEASAEYYTDHHEGTREIRRRDGESIGRAPDMQALREELVRTQLFTDIRALKDPIERVVALEDRAHQLETVDLDREHAQIYDALLHEEQEAAARALYAEVMANPAAFSLPREGTHVRKDGQAEEVRREVYAQVLDEMIDEGVTMDDLNFGNETHPAVQRLAQDLEHHGAV